MGWFDEQIRSRKLSDDEAFAESFADIAGAVLGPKAAAAFRTVFARASNWRPGLFSAPGGAPFSRRGGSDATRRPQRRPFQPARRL